MKTPHNRQFTRPLLCFLLLLCSVVGALPAGAAPAGRRGEVGYNQAAQQVGAVAVVDSGFSAVGYSWRVLDAATGTLRAGDAAGSVIYRDFVVPGSRTPVEPHGHGGQVVAASRAGGALGNLVVARAFAADGSARRADLVAAIDWIVAHRAEYNVRVLTLAWSSPVTGPYWGDPLGQAAMRAWQAGIVVVAAAGDAGPGPGTIGAPGNVPYVITVGALARDRSGAQVPAPSSGRGPTESAFTKPDLLAPAADSTLAAAGVSNMAARLLAAEPTLTNDQVKYRLLATARPALYGHGGTAYTIWEQGAGQADAGATLAARTSDRANVGLQIAVDLSTRTHYWGLTTWDGAAGLFSLTDPATGAPLMWLGSEQLWSGRSTSPGAPGVSWRGSSQVWSGPLQLGSGTGRVWLGGAGGWAAGASGWAGSSAGWLAPSTGGPSIGPPRAVR